MSGFRKKHLHNKAYSIHSHYGALCNQATLMDFFHYILYRLIYFKRQLLEDELCIQFHIQIFMQIIQSIHFGIKKRIIRATTDKYNLLDLLNLLKKCLQYHISLQISIHFKNSSCVLIMAHQSIKLIAWESYS